VTHLDLSNQQTHMLIDLYSGTAGTVNVDSFLTTKDYSVT
jgi:hypothetical protein